MCYGQILEQSLRKARKDHRCSSCGRRIRKGSHYEYQASIDSGEWGHWKQCMRCTAAIEQLDVADGDHCIFPGYVHETLHDEAVTIGWRALREKLRDWIDARLTKGGRDEQ